MIAADVKYKKTGNEWVPEIPEHWDFRRLKNFAEIGSGQTQNKLKTITVDTSFTEQEA